VELLVQGKDVGQGWSELRQPPCGLGANDPNLERIVGWSDFGGYLEIEYDNDLDRYTAEVPGSPLGLTVPGATLRELYGLSSPRTVREFEMELAWADGYVHHELFLQSLKVTGLA
jgi:hypothetical protein